MWDDRVGDEELEEWYNFEVQKKQLIFIFSSFLLL
jgi:hypothetical protein